jgi:hypothetical protein
MQVNIKPIKLALYTGIITLIMIVVYAFSKHDASQAQTTSSRPSEQQQKTDKDPFKEFLDNRQQVASSQSIQVQPSQPIQIVSGNSTTTVPVGSDPFKAFLDAQSKAKPEEAVISPFSRGK